MSCFALKGQNRQRRRTASSRRFPRPTEKADTAPSFFCPYVNGEKYAEHFNPLVMTELQKRYNYLKGIGFYLKRVCSTALS
nr:MAG TPA_asm: hypothetical protein [Caudoviricetes sp.]